MIDATKSMVGLYDDVMLLKIVMIVSTTVMVMKKPCKRSRTGSCAVHCTSHATVDEYGGDVDVGVRRIAFAIQKSSMISLRCGPTASLGRRARDGAQACSL